MLLLGRFCGPAVVRAMPELPEVETIVRYLTGRVSGQCVRRVRVFDAWVLRGVSAAVLQKRMRGARIVSVERRGKQITIRLDNQMDVLIHLRMTGQLLHKGADDWIKEAGVSSPAVHGKKGHSGSDRSAREQAARSASASSRPPVIGDRYVRVLVEFEDGSALAYRDVRKLGTIGLVPRGEAKADNLGPEPLSRDMTTAVLETAFAKRRAPIKAVLLDQRVVAGIGNIYASEILYRARIDPRRSARELLRSEVEAVRTAIRDVLREAIRQGGTTFRDYRNARGGRGGFRPRVYKRAGESCDLCGTGLERTVIAGRSTFWCPHCQC